MRHRLTRDDADYDVFLAKQAGNDRLLLGDEWHPLQPIPPEAVILVRGDTAHIHLNGRAHAISLRDPFDTFANAADQSGANLARAPMPGAIVSLKVSPGEAVSAGDPMVVIESMKLETVIRAPREGIVEKLFFAVGESFERDAILVSLIAGEV